MQLISLSQRLAVTARARFCRSEEGSSIVEYLLLLFLIAIVSMIAVGLFGLANSKTLTNVANSVVSS